MIEEFCLYNDSECQISNNVFENKQWKYLDLCNHATLYFRFYKEGSKYLTNLFKMDNMCIICLKYQVVLKHVAQFNNIRNIRPSCCKSIIFTSVK